jgi:hypothetical protein
MEKINKALEKLDILEENLNADKRTYYLIMIAVYFYLKEIY